MQHGWWHHEEVARDKVGRWAGAYGGMPAQAAMPEQLLVPEPAGPEHDDREQQPGRREALDLTALRALRESRTDVEALDLTTERLRHLDEAFTAAADRARTRMGRYARRDAAGRPATECIRCRTPDAVHRTGDAVHPPGVSP
ncbi:hypothetical protein [Streptomyces sp. NPDC018347]|uniref:hypothetical protein n=1 Tax=Streptomyces sp. NPDC018347 TaxID=3157193 RepID=UPI0034100ACB